MTVIASIKYDCKTPYFELVYVHPGEWTNHPNETVLLFDVLSGNSGVGKIIPDNDGPYILLLFAKEAADQKFIHPSTITYLIVPNKDEMDNIKNDPDYLKTSFYKQTELQNEKKI